MSFIRLVALAGVLAISPLRASASHQAVSNSDALAAEASTAYEAKDWAKAAKLYEELSHLPEAPPRVWLRLGAALRELGKYQDALPAFEKANAGGAALFGEYGEAAVYTAMKQPEKAFDPITSKKRCSKATHSRTS